MSAQPVLFELDPQLQIPERVGRAVVTERLSKQILTVAKGMISSYDFSLNPYVGCSFGCSYCYAAFFVPEERRAADWGNWVEVKTNALELLRHETRLPGAKVYVGSVTDPYQPVEAKTRLTRSLLEHMATLHPQPRVVIQTRSPLVTADIDVYQRFENLRVNMSVTTDDDETRKRFEPGCASIPQRMGAVTELVRSGVASNICLSPMLPVTDAAAFAKELVKTGANRVTSSYFHLGTRKFASGTRENALVLAKELGWNFERYLETVSVLRRLVPGFVSSEAAFGPV